MFSLQYDCIIESIYDDVYHSRFSGHKLIKIEPLKLTGDQKKTHTYASNDDHVIYGFETFIADEGWQQTVFRIKMKRREKKLLTLIHSEMIFTGKTSKATYLKKSHHLHTVGFQALFSKSYPKKCERRGKQ